MSQKVSPRSSGVMLPSMTERLFQTMDIQLLLAQDMELSTEWHYRLISPFWRIYVHDRAGAYLELSGQRIHIEPNTIVVIPAWLTFETSLDGPVRQYVIHFEFRGLSPTRQRRLLDKIVTLPLSGMSESLFASWLDSLSSQGIATTAKATAFMYEVLSNLADQELDFRGLREEQTINTTLEPALHQIESNPHLSFNNAELAERCGLSVDHFIRIFRKSTGLTPGRYRMELRLTNAARMLTNTSSSIEHIAEATGFADRFHFSKAFKKFLEVSPGHYRSSHELA